MKWELAKLQTFGVEVEMNHIGREQAAKLAASFFGTGRVEYVGTYYDTWAAYDSKGRKWQFMTDASISGSRNQQCEMVTPILRYDDDMETFQELIRKLRSAGAVSNTANGCGVHIHIGKDGHTAKSLRNLVNLMASHENLLINSIGISRDRVEYVNHQPWCQRVHRPFLEQLNSKKPETIDEVLDIWYGTSDDRSDRTAHYHKSRYRMLNFHSIQKGTVEFRMFQFDNPTAEKKNGLHAGMMKAYVQLCLVMSQEAKEKRSISASPVQMENEKFAMRTWMNRMGMIGEEFKTAHEIYRRKLSGDAAFRYGRPE